MKYLGLVVMIFCLASCSAAKVTKTCADQISRLEQLQADIAIVKAGVEACAAQPNE
jgi:hypothetical protein